jgi:hypothetical protein
MPQRAADPQATTKSQIKAAKRPSLHGQRVNAESRRLMGQARLTKTAEPVPAAQETSAPGMTPVTGTGARAAA